MSALVKAFWRVYVRHAARVRKLEAFLSATLLRPPNATHKRFLEFGWLAILGLARRHAVSALRMAPCCSRERRTCLFHDAAEAAKPPRDCVGGGGEEDELPAQITGGALGGS